MNHSERSTPWRRITILPLIVLLALACNLTASETAATPTPGDAPPTLTPQPDFPTPTQETLTDQPVLGESEPVDGVGGGCTVREDWPLYTVLPGDTLLSIAQRVGSSVEDIVLGNCLDNPDAIFVDQQLRVPTLPQGIPDNSEGVGEGGVITQGQIAANVGAFTEDGGWRLPFDGAATFTWNGAPSSGVAEIVFYFQSLRNDGTVGPPEAIGTDFNPADGASVTWDYSGTFNGLITARASEGGDIPLYVPVRNLPVYSLAGG